MEVYRYLFLRYCDKKCPSMFKVEKKKMLWWSKEEWLHFTLPG